MSRLLDRILGADTTEQIDRARDALDNVDEAMDHVLDLAADRINRNDGDPA